MRISKVRDVKTPERGTGRSAGIDFFVPNFENNLILRPHSDLLIPSGIKAELPKGYMLMAADKSGIVTSKGACLKAGRKPKDDSFLDAVIIGAKIVDEDYQGEIYIHLINTGRGLIRITPGMKIAQFILVPVLYEGIEVVPEEELFKECSERGTGGFGSTNKD